MYGFSETCVRAAAVIRGSRTLFRLVSYHIDVEFVSVCFSALTLRPPPLQGLTQLDFMSLNMSCPSPLVIFLLLLLSFGGPWLMVSVAWAVCFGRWIP
jgi:hypothetical protein